MSRMPGDAALRDTVDDALGLEADDLADLLAAERVADAADGEPVLVRARARAGHRGGLTTLERESRAERVDGLAHVVHFFGALSVSVVVNVLPPSVAVTLKRSFFLCLSAFRYFLASLNLTAT
ncbi:MAG: hypothetical protein QOG15_1810 [Solirubrobacteraceae bacterium]|nr:hypothetical protein [Solirubrobacteraceae bacterium]